jgi:hypothetical protein
MRPPPLPPIQIYYVKYLAQSLVWLSHFREPPVVTGGSYERVAGLNFEHSEKEVGFRHHWLATLKQPFKPPATGWVETPSKPAGLPSSLDPSCLVSIVTKFPSRLP